MRTEKQREAARRNGAKSRGPRTPEGKSKSSANSYRHGLYSQKGSPENNALMVELHAVLNQIPAPVTPRTQSLSDLEAYLHAKHRWAYSQIERVREFETRLINSEIARQRRDRPEPNAPALAFNAFRRLCRETRVPQLIHRLDDFLFRQWETAVRRLHQFQALNTVPDAISRNRNRSERTQDRQRDSKNHLERTRDGKQNFENCSERTQQTELSAPGKDLPSLKTFIAGGGWISQTLSHDSQTRSGQQKQSSSANFT